MSRLDHLQELAAAKLVEDLNRAGEAVLGEAQRRAPIDEGTLRGSGVLILVVNGRRFEGEGGISAATSAAVAAVRSGVPLEVNAEISFNTPYAARQHEELDWEHPKGGEAKYLERSLNEVVPRVVPLIAAGQRSIMTGL